MMDSKAVNIIKNNFNVYQTIVNAPFLSGFSPGEHIIDMGDVGDCLYVIESGTVETSYEGVTLERISDGEIFGEMALVDDTARSANAVAITDVVALTINKELFLELVRKNPEFSLMVMDTMVRRMRQMNVRLKMARR